MRGYRWTRGRPPPTGCGRLAPWPELAQAGDDDGDSLEDRARQIFGASPPPPANLPDKSLDQELLFKFLLSEIAGQRGNLQLAAQGYLDMAKSTRDPRLARRATEIANYARLPEHRAGGVPAVVRHRQGQPAGAPGPGERPAEQQQAAGGQAASAGDAQRRRRHRARLPAIAEPAGQGRRQGRRSSPSPRIWPRATRRCPRRISPWRRRLSPPASTISPTPRPPRPCACGPTGTWARCCRRR